MMIVDNCSVCNKVNHVLVLQDISGKKVCDNCCALSPYEVETLTERIQLEGFDYCFLDYSSWGEIQSQLFHRYLDALKKAHKELKQYLIEQGVGVYE